MSFQSGTLVEFHIQPPISREQLKTYSDASGDFNPIHLEDEAAKKSGLPGVIAHGMYIASLIEGRAVDFVRKEAALENFELMHFQARFKAMTFLGDSPSIGGTVKEINSEILTLELQAKNQSGEVLTTGIARFRKTTTGSSARA